MRNFFELFGLVVVSFFVCLILTMGSDYLLSLLITHVAWYAFLTVAAGLFWVVTMFSFIDWYLDNRHKLQ